MFSPKVDTVSPENLLLTSHDGGFIREVEVLRVTYNEFFLRDTAGFNGFRRRTKEVSRSISTFIASTPSEVVSPMCYVDKLEYGRKLNNTGVQLCLL